MFRVLKHLTIRHGQDAERAGQWQAAQAAGPQEMSSRDCAARRRNGGAMEKHLFAKVKTWSLFREKHIVFLNEIGC